MMNMAGIARGAALAPGWNSGGSTWTEVIMDDLVLNDPTACEDGPLYASLS